MNTNLATTKAYDRIAPRYSRVHFKHFWVKEFDFFKRAVPGRKVIDIGCGAGRDATVFVKHGFDYLGTDGSKGMLKVARRRVRRGKFRYMDFYKLRLPAHSFDGFWAAASLLHVPKNKIVQVLKGIQRITKLQGIGFISVKEKGSIGEAFLPYPRNPGSYRYWSFYTKTEFAYILRKSGFRVIKFMKHLEPEADGSKTTWLCFFVKTLEKK